MSQKPKHLTLEDLKKALRPAPETKTAQPSKPAQGARASKSNRPPPIQTTPEEDAQAFRQAMSGTQALGPINLAQVEPPKPLPIVRPRIKEDAPEPKTRTGNELNLPESWFSDKPSHVTELPQVPEKRMIAIAFQGVTPIQTDKVLIEAPKPAPRPIQREQDEQSALEESIFSPTPLELRLEGGDELAYLREKMPRTLLRDLRRGRWTVQAQLDLHGANRDEAREMLAAFVGQCRKQQTRCIRIIHGKGLGSPGKEPVLKGLVAGWLANYDDVIAYVQAPVHDGGAGALLVLLKAKRA